MIQYTLHKLPEGFILTSDEEIKRNHKYLSLKSMMIFDHDYDDNKSLTDFDFKVIAQQDQIDFSALSEEEQQRIGWFDVGVYALKQSKKFAKSETDYTLGCIDGFQKAQELSDRMFTLEDMIDFTRMCRENDSRKLIEDKELLQTTDLFEQWKSLSQPKSWKVKIEMEEYGTIAKDFKDVNFRPKSTNGKIKILKLI